MMHRIGDHALSYSIPLIGKTLALKLEVVKLEV